MSTRSSAAFTPAFVRHPQGPLRPSGRLGSMRGYRDDGARLVLRTIYGPHYYGAFLLDPDGNSAEAVYTDREKAVPEGKCRPISGSASAIPSRRVAFTYTTIAP